MKNLFLASLFSICMLQVNSQLTFVEKPTVLPAYLSSFVNNETSTTLDLQPGQDDGRMSAAMFKVQEYCRAELYRFEFEAHFSVVGATVYFSGANFRNVEKGTITSSSLKPIKELMNRCTAGSIVAFDDVKVIGPDQKVRTIPGAVYTLY